MTENTRALVRYRMEQAREALDAARLLLEGGHHRSALNRAYYAMFYGVLALLVTLKMETSRHSAAIGLFDLHFVKAGALPKEFSRWLHDTFDLRQSSDYGERLTVTPKVAAEAVSKASAFVDRVASVLESQGAPGGGS